MDRRTGTTLDVAADLHDGVIEDWALPAAPMRVQPAAGSSWLGGSGDWGTPGDWSGGVPNGSTAVAGITVAGSYVTIAGGESFTVGTLTLANSTATLAIDGSLTLAGKFSLTSGNLDLVGTLIGGTVAETGGTTAWNGGTLQGVTWQGTLSMSAAFIDLTVTDGLTLTNAAGSGPGALSLTGFEATLICAGSETLDDATITFGSEEDKIQVEDAGAPTTLTLGKHLSLVASVPNEANSLSAYSNDDALVNEGSIAVSGSATGLATAFYSDGFVTFTNEGTITVSAGALLSFVPDYFVNAAGGTITTSGAGTTLTFQPLDSFSNAGTITIGAGDALYIEPKGSWSAAGSISLGAGAELYLGGSFLVATLSTITGIADALTITPLGTLDNAGTVFAVGTGTALGQVQLDGTIQGGVVTDAGSGFVFAGGILDGVTCESTLAISTTNATLTIVDGISVTGAGGTGNGTIALDGALATLTFGGTQTLDDATLAIGGAGDTVSLSDTTEAGATLTLGPDFTLAATAAGIEATVTGAFDTILVNQGTISAAASDDGLSVTGFAQVTNDGLFLATAGGTLTIDPASLGNFSGTTLSGGSFEADAGSSIRFGAGTEIATVDATIILDGTGSAIETYDTATSRWVTLDATLTTIGSTGTLELEDGRTFTSGLAVTNDGSLQLAGASFAGAGLANDGTISGYGTVAAPLGNNGTISVDGAVTLDLVALANLSGTTLSGGSYAAAAGGTLELAEDSRIVTLDATIILSGGGSEIQAFDTASSSQVTLDATLDAIGSAGTLELLAGRSFTTSRDIANAGTLDLGGGSFQAAGLADAAGSTLTGFGTVAVQVSGGGAVTASGGTLSFTASGNSFAGTLGGTTIAFTAGSETFAAGSSLAAADLSFSGGVSLTLATSLAYGGSWNEAGTLATDGDTLTLSGISTFTGSVTGTGTLAFAGGAATVKSGASVTMAGWAVSAGSVTIAQSLAYGGTLTAGQGTTISVFSGDTLSLGHAAGLSGKIAGAGTLAVTGGTAQFGQGASLSIAGVTLGSATVTVTTTLGYSGTFTAARGATLDILTGDSLSLGGGSTLAGKVNGAGTLDFTGGSAVLATGASLAVANLGLSGAATLVTLDHALSYAGSFAESGGTLDLGGAELTLKGAASFGTAASLTGSSELTLDGTTTVTGLAIGGTVELNNEGRIDDTGTITLGPASGSTARLLNGKAGIIDLDGDVTIAPGAGARVLLVNEGHVIETAGGGLLSVAIDNSGSLEVRTGTLDLASTVEGTGSVTIDQGATLDVAGSVAANQTIDFAGSAALLAIGSAGGFHAGISGFAALDTIDLATFSYHKTETLGFVENAGDSQGVLTVTDGASVIKITLFGQYVAAGFGLSRDAVRGTDVTYVPPASQNATPTLAGANH